VDREEEVHVDKLTEAESAALLDAATRVHTYKVMQAKAYARLAARA